MSAWTTAAVKNYSMHPPEEPVAPIDYMPSHRDAKQRAPELSEDELERVSAYNVRVAELALKLKEQANAH